MVAAEPFVDGTQLLRCHTVNPVLCRCQRKRAVARWRRCLRLFVGVIQEDQDEDQEEVGDNIHVNADLRKVAVDKQKDEVNFKPKYSKIRTSAMVSQPGIFLPARDRSNCTVMSIGQINRAKAPDGDSRVEPLQKSQSTTLRKGS